MASDLPHQPAPNTLDLTGLPEPFVQGIRQIVDAVRVQLRDDEPSSHAVERRPLMGRFADPNLAVPKEHIDEARREAWAGFPRDFPEPPKSS